MLGIHVTKKSKVLEPPERERKTMKDAIEFDTSILGLNCAQIFTYGPRSRRRVSINYNNVKNYCVENGISLVVHSSYPSIKIWDVNERNKNSKESKDYIKHIFDQLDSCQKIGAFGFVLHTKAENIEKIIETLKILEPIILKTKVRLILENPGIKSTPETFETPDKLNNLCYYLKHSGLNSKYWGLCIDTAHLWSSGVDVSSGSSMMEWLRNFNYKNKISLFHLNGSSSNMGSKDIHAIAFLPNDKIWHKYYINNDIRNSGAYVVIKFCKKNKIPIICEINIGTQHEAEISLNIIRENM